MWTSIPESAKGSRPSHSRPTKIIYTHIIYVAFTENNAILRNQSLYYYINKSDLIQDSYQ